MKEREPCSAPVNDLAIMAERMAGIQGGVVDFIVAFDRWAASDELCRMGGLFFKLLEARDSLEKKIDDYWLVGVEDDEL